MHDREAKRLRPRGGPVARRRHPAGRPEEAGQEAWRGAECPQVEEAVRGGAGAPDGSSRVVRGEGTARTRRLELRRAGSVAVARGEPLLHQLRLLANQFNVQHRRTIKITPFAASPNARAARRPVSLSTKTHPRNSACPKWSPGISISKSHSHQSVYEASRQTEARRFHADRTPRRHRDHRDPRGHAAARAGEARHQTRRHSVGHAGEYAADAGNALRRADVPGRAQHAEHASRRAYSGLHARSCARHRLHL